jgi:Mn2+/Fe2+ NRAMP family transporter
VPEPARPVNPLSASGRLAWLGPGILYAAVAIGVSHLVQATRAGAVYGLGMLLVLLLVALVKYPAIRFGSQYAAATGKSLPESYLEQGWWAAGLYVAAQISGIWFGLAAVAITTAGLLRTVAPIAVPPLPLAGLLMAGVAAVLILGHYRWLERLGKAFVLLLAVLVTVATALALPRIEWSLPALLPPALDGPTLFFVVAMAGWMPTPLEGGVLTSVWTAAKYRETGVRLSPRAVRLDFDVGYGLAMVLAAGFLLLGVAVLHQQGIAPEGSPGAFAAQVIRLFTDTMGAWAGPVIGVAAVAALLSTLLTMMDGFPRQFVAMVRHVRGAEPPAWLLPVFVVAYAVGAWLLLATLLTSLATFLDFATTLGFLMTPVYAFLNHRAMTSAEVEGAYRPSRALRLWSLGAMGLLTVTSVAWLVLRFGN